MEKGINLQKWARFFPSGELLAIYAFDGKQDFDRVEEVWVRIITDLPVSEEGLAVYEMLYPNLNFETLLRIKDTYLEWDVAVKLLNAPDSDGCYFKRVHKNHSGGVLIGPGWI